MYGGSVPQGYVTPAPPVGVGRGSRWSYICILCTYPPVMVMILRMMSMEGLSHSDTLPPPPSVGVGRGLQSYCICVVLLLYRGLDR